MSHDIGRMISTHKSAANRIRIGHDRSILCFRGIPSAGNAMVMTISSSSKAKAWSTKGGQRSGQITKHFAERRAHVDEESAGGCAWAKAHDRSAGAGLCAFAHAAI